MRKGRLTRRAFLGSAGLAGGAIGLIGQQSVEGATLPPLKIEGAKETLSICPYCAVGCGLVVHTLEGKVVNIEGDPQHPINNGALCSKGSAILEVAQNPLRLQKVKYRAPGSAVWVEKDLAWALGALAERVKRLRDATFQKADESGVPVNRTKAMAVIGGAALDNEECYLLCKLARALGVVFLEHQARLCHSSTVAALGPTFGRGAMTNHWIDIKNSDCVFVIGANPAGNHPVSFYYINKAREAGAKLIVADPRFNRSASQADLFIRLRPGTDIALIGGMINHVMQNNLHDEAYVREYTNASFLVREDFRFDDGLFSGYDAAARRYDATTWDYQTDADGKPLQDKTLQHPRTIFQLLKAQYSRYTPDAAMRVTGVPPADFEKLCRTYCATGSPGKSGTILYAMGATQHTVGVQYIRSYAILQLLLGNMGVPGGGINALRGESNVQGSTDMGLLADALPGYMALPDRTRHQSLRAYLERETPKSGYWTNKPKFLVSLLKAFWGEAARKDNDFCYDYLPKIGSGGFRGGGFTWLSLFQAMYAGEIKGMLVWGMNPSVSCSNANMANQALGKLDWLAVFDLWETETAAFWKRPGANPKDIGTEVFLFPAAASFEKEGTITNSGRWMQRRSQAVEPPGQARSDLWYLDSLYRELKRLYVSDASAVFPDPILNLNWNYGENGPDVELVAREINGYTVADKAQLANFTRLADDGSTACGNWLYSGFYPGPRPEDNKAAARDAADPSGLGLYPGWAYAWPLNRRVLYNRASADAAGTPWNKERALVRWDAAKKAWVNHDVPDFAWKDAKTGEMIPPETSAASPFIMLPEAKARLFVPRGATRDGPFPEHYEPLESPVANVLSRRQNNPVIRIWDADLDKTAPVGSKEFPVIATTFRLSEHWQAGAMTRNLPLLVELVPEMFVEMSPELARARGIKEGEWVLVVSPRGQCRARAVVTRRMQAYRLGEERREVVALPWHFGFSGLARGGPHDENYAANQLSPNVGDANTNIPEYKAFLCDVRKLG